MKVKKIAFNNFAQEVKEHRQVFEKTISDVLQSGWFILGREVESFEQQFADYLGVPFCISVGNGLEALQISLMAIGIGKGDEVITTPLSAVATTLAILAVGAKPVFVDTKPNGLINPDLIESVINKRTKAILPVHLYGHPIDLDKIIKICKRYNIFLVDDACQAHGSLYHGQKIGTFGDLACFSFYPTKNLGAFGDGGAIVTKNKKLAAICREIRDYGQSGKYRHVRLGLNSRLDEVQAAILKVKLKYLDQCNEKRREMAKRYIDNLAILQEVEPIMADPLNKPNFHLFVIKTPHRNKLQNYLKEKGVGTLIHYPMIIPQQPFLKSSFKLNNFPVATRLTDQILSLPCHPYMSMEDVDYISETIYSFHKKTL